MDRNLIVMSIFFAIVIIAILLLGIETKHYTTGMRGYVAEQGIWAKEQKEAVIELIQYAHSRDEKHFKNYQNHIGFIESSIAAREEMDKPNPDLKLVNKELMAGDKDGDINKQDMIEVYRHLDSNSYLSSIFGGKSFNKAFAERDLAEQHMAALQDKAYELHHLIETHELSEAREDSMVSKIYQLDQHMTGHEKKFTYLMDKAARHVEGELFYTLTIVGIILLVLFLAAASKLLFDLKNWKRSIITSLDQFRLLFENSAESILLISPDAQIKAANPSACKLFDITEKKLLNKNCSELILESKRDKTKFFQNLDKKGYNAETLEFKTMNGTSFIGHISSSVFTDEQGDRQAYCLIRDVTKREEYLKRLEENEQGYRDLINSIRDGIFIQDKNERYVQVNEEAADMYGIPKNSMIGKKPEELEPDLKESFKSIRTYFIKAYHGDPQIIEWWGKKVEGELHPKEIKLVSGSYKGRKVVIGVARDITERKKAEKKIKKNEQLFKQLFLNAPMGIVFYDREKNVKKVNHSFESMFGYTENELKHIDVFKELVPQHLKDEANDIARLALAGQPEQIETVRKKKDGSLISVKMALIPVISNQQVIGIYAMFTDITDRKLAEERKILLSEIHHRVKNNMAIISGMLQLQSFETDNPEIKNLLHDSQLRIQSMASIHELLYQSDHFTDINFKAYMEKLIRNIQSTLDNDIDIQKKIELELNVDDDISLNINQAIPAALLMNELITNAYKHAFTNQDKGSIDVRVEEIKSEIELLVQDNGKGLPDDFEKSSADSLGMTLVDTLVNQLEARLSIGNGVGSKFQIKFHKDKHTKGSASALLN